MENFINLSAFPAMLFESFDQHDHAFSVVTARISYDFDIASGSLTFCAEQPELVEQDEYYGEPGRSSVCFESDLAPWKPRLDVVINGTAWAPGDKPVREFTVGAQIGDFTRLLRIYGPREWRKMIAGWSLSAAQPIISLPLRYEYAAGGFYTLQEGEEYASPANTAGMGWYSAEYLKKINKQRLPAPQIELLPQPIKSIDEISLPAGFGFFGRGWQGRIEYAGTYDEAWQRDRHPFLPTDFRFDYWCGAHPWMQFPLPQPLQAVPIKLKYLIRAQEKSDQEISFHVPVESLFIFITTAKGAGVAKDMQLDTLVIDLPQRKVHCTYRAAVSENMEPVMTELRFIQRSDREVMLKRAEEMNADPSSQEFMPLPPSLAAKLPQENHHG